MRSYQNAARISHNSFLQRSQSIDVQIVGRFVQHDHVGAFAQHFRQVDAVAFAARQLPDFFLLIAAFEIELADISAGRKLFFAERNHIQTVGNFFPHVFVGVQLVAALVNIAQIDRVTDTDGSGIRFFLSGNHAEQRCFAGAVGPDNADDCPLRNLKRQIVDQNPVAVAFADVLGLNYQIAETFGHRNIDVGGGNLVFRSGLQQFVISVDTRF